MRIRSSLFVIRLNEFIVSSVCEYVNATLAHSPSFVLNGETKFEPGARMVIESNIDAILLTVAEFQRTVKAICPFPSYPKCECTGDGVNIVNPTTGFELSLIGNADYGLCTYELESKSLQGSKERATQCVVLLLTRSRSSWVEIICHR